MNTHTDTTAMQSGARAVAEGLPITTPVQLLYREWAVKHRHASKSGFTEDEMSALCAEMDEFADKLLVLPSASPLDVIAKFLAASDCMEIQTRDEWVDSIREEAIAFVEGAHPADMQSGTITLAPDLPKMTFHELVAVFEELRTIAHVLSGTMSQPRFAATGGRSGFNAAGSFFEDFNEGVCILWSRVVAEITSRTPMNARDQDARDYAIVANSIDAQSGIEFCLADAVKDIGRVITVVGASAEVRS